MTINSLYKIKEKEKKIIVSHQSNRVLMSPKMVRGKIYILLHMSFVHQNCQSSCNYNINGLLENHVDR